MARPMAAAGFAYLVGLIFTACFLPMWGGLAAFALLSPFLLTALIYSLKSRSFCQYSAAALCLLLAFVQYGIFFGNEMRPALAYDDKEGEVTAYVNDVRVYDDYDLYFCSLETFEGTPVREDIKFIYPSYEMPPVDAGDRFAAIVRFHAEDLVYSPDSMKSYVSDGYLLSAGKTEGSTEMLSKGETDKGLASRAADFFSVRLKRYLPISGSDLADAMLFGNRESISTGVTDDFRLSGIAHLLAISGFHLTILSGFVQVFCDFLGLGRRTRSIITALFVLCYMFITGMPYSVMRAGLMSLVMCLSQLSGRERDSLSALSFSVLFICVISPMSIWDMGFLMSVSSMLGIILIHEKIQEFCSEYIYESTLPPGLRLILKAILPPLSVGFSAAAAVFPMVAVSYRYYNLLSIFTTALLAVPTAVLLSCSMAVAVLGDLGISRLLGAAVSISADILKSAAKFFSEHGGAAMPFTAWLFVLFFIAAVAVLSVSRSRLSVRKFTAAALCCLVVFSAVVIHDTYSSREMKGLYISVSDSGVSLLAAKGKKAYVISTARSLGYAPRRFASDMNLEIIGYGLKSGAPEGRTDIFGDGEDSFSFESVGMTADIFGRSIAINYDDRVSGQYDIVLQQLKRGEEKFVPTGAEMLTVLCHPHELEPEKLLEIMPAGSNITLCEGCGVFIDMTEEITVKKYDYGY